MHQKDIKNADTMMRICQFAADHVGSGAMFPEEALFRGRIMQMEAVFMQASNRENATMLDGACSMLNETCQAYLRNGGAGRYTVLVHAILEGSTKTQSLLSNRGE